MRYYKLFALTIVLLLSVNFILADFKLGNSLLYGNTSYEIETNYGTNKPIKGWINISFEDANTDSILNAFDSNITLLDFMQDNSADYDCNPLDCKLNYIPTGTKLTTKQFSFNSRQKQVLGIKITGNITGIQSFSFDISTNVEESCDYPLKINILDNELIEWKHNKVIAKDCFMANPTGCFTSSSSLSNITTTPFCEKILLTPSKAYRIGAVVSGTGKEYFQLSLDGESCTTDISSSGEISCVIEFEEALEYPSESIICISAKPDSINKYKIKYEDINPCGYSGTEDQEKFYDFEIFAKPQKYSSISNPVKFNKNLIGEDAYSSMLLDIFDYISERYDNNCTNGCMIPIALLPGLRQDLKIENLSLVYEIRDDLNPKVETGFYLVNSVPATLSSGYQELDLEKANLLTPLEIGKKDFILRLDDTKIFEKEIIIKSIPDIIAIVPSKPSALVPSNFIVILNNSVGNITYTWNFGDNTTEQTSAINSMKHTYSETGIYNLKLKIQGGFGESTESFNINVITPKEGINQTIKEYRENLKNLKKQIDLLIPIVKTEIEKLIDIDSLEKTINKKEENFKDAISDEEYIKIMKELLELRVPEKLDKAVVINPAVFFQNENQIKPEDLEYLDAGTVEAENNEYYNAMNNWIRENLNTTFESETYVFDYKNEPMDYLFSHIKLTINTKNDIDYLYIMINGNPDKIKVPLEFTEKDVEGTAKAIILKDLTQGETKVIEFIYPLKIDLETLPFYISPELNQLELNFEPGSCNNNGKCESGETIKNCRNDCKPWGRAILFFFILLFIGFIAYIALQEWYKRKYESHLFKDSNQLFNLINFINISKNQGMEKLEIFNNLKNNQWKKEQIVYAWKRFHGERTGMWEIPVFRIFEKRRVKQELEKRKNNMPLNNRKLNKENSNPNYKRF